MGGMGMGAMNPARMVIMMREQLKLTDDQVTRIDAIKPADPNAPQKAQRELAETQQALRVAVVAADEAKIKELCKQLGQVTEKASLLQAQEYKQIKQILTADQYKELQQMMTRPMAGRMGGQGGMGGGQGGRMGGGMGGGMGGPGAPGGNPPPVRPNTGGGN
jgi:Spy/CpxP family protein refolding chaperone